MSGLYSSSIQPRKAHEVANEQVRAEAEGSGVSHESNAVNREQPSNLASLVGKPYRDFDDAGHYIGCFEPFYLLYPNLPKYALPEVKEAYFRRGFEAILENFDEVTSPEPLDMIVFRFKGDILHVGVFLDGGKFFHVQRGSAFEIRRLLPYRNKILGYYRAKSYIARKY